MIALTIAAAAMASPACVDTLCNARVLKPYFEKLAETGSAAGKRPLHILQIGDSHTAGDTITGAWRELLQAKYGAGGRGVLPPGRPYQGYLTHGITAEMSPGWKVSAIFGSESAPPRPMMGLTGFSLTSTQEGARIALTADAGQMFDRVTICAQARPDAGTIAIRIGPVTQRMKLDSATARPECRTVTMPQPQFGVEVIAEDGPVTITSWATFRDNGGVALSNLGVVGAQLAHFARTDDAVLAEELRSYRPDLIVVAFGTNEGFAPVFRPGEYEITLRTQIGRLRRLAGNVPILLLGAPDASSRRPEMLRNAPGPAPAPCAEPVSTPPPSPPLANVMASLRADEGGESMMEMLPPGPVYMVRPDPLFPPAGLHAVREVQRRVAQALHVAFWDWETRMGGRCSAVRWVKGSPPLMRGDYVHFNSAGGREIGSRLQADLERAAATSAAGQ